MDSEDGVVNEFEEVVVAKKDRGVHNMMKNIIGEEGGSKKNRRCHKLSMFLVIVFFYVIECEQGIDSTG